MISRKDLSDCSIHLSREGSILADGEVIGRVDRSNAFPGKPWRAEVFAGTDEYTSAYGRTRKAVVKEVLSDA